MGYMVALYCELTDEMHASSDPQVKAKKQADRAEVKAAMTPDELAELRQVGIRLALKAVG